MSQKIAPGKWDAAKRKLAKNWSVLVGVVMLAVGAWLGNVLIVNSLQAGNQVNVWGAAIPLVFLVGGVIATFPDVVTPIVYRVIDRLGKSK